MARPSTSSPAVAPPQAMAPAVIGRNSICPTEPPALTSPMAALRRSGGKARATPAKETPQPSSAMPVPVISPMPSVTVRLCGQIAGKA